MDAGQSHVATSTDAVSSADPRSIPQLESHAFHGGPPLRVLLAERRASAQSELSRRLTDLGHEVLARVTSAQGAVDYAGFLCPDVVLISPMLEDGIGIMAAMTVTRDRPGVAAVVLTDHPSVANPTARPNWGAIALLPIEADTSDLDGELRRAVSRAREAAGQPALQAYRPTASMANASSAAPAAIAQIAVVPATDSPVADARAADGPTSDLGLPDIAVPALMQVMSVEAAVAVLTDAEESESDAAIDALDAMVNAAYDAVTPVPGDDAPDTSRDDIRETIDRDTDTVESGWGDDVAGVTVPDREMDAMGESDDAIVARAVEQLVERSQLMRSDALRLMEQEAEDTDQSMADVARAMLGEGTNAKVSGEMASVA